MHDQINDPGSGNEIGEDALLPQSGQAGTPAKYLVDKLRELEDAA